MKSLIRNVSSYVTAKPWITLAISFGPFIAFIAISILVDLRSWIVSFDSIWKQETVWIIFTVMVILLVIGPIIFAAVNLMQVRGEPLLNKKFHSVRRFNEFINKGNLSCS